MNKEWRFNVLLILLAYTVINFKGIYVDALSYDYSIILDCLAEPIKPQYGGGIIVNPEMNEGLNAWTTHGGVKIEHRVSDRGNNFIVAHSRRHHYGSLSQKLFLDKEILYTFSAWIQITGNRNIPVMAMFKTSEGFKSAGSVVAQVGCWSMLKGGITVNSSGPAELYFQSNDTSVEIWVDSVSLQPFTQEEWRSHQYESIEKVRKSKVKIQVLDSKGRPLPYTNISIKLGNARFPIGVSINNNIVNNAAYQKWFLSKFTVTTFENEMKWYTIENVPGKEDYSLADAMIDFTTKHGIQVRGHNIFWDDPKYQLQWVRELSPSDLIQATNRRLNSIISRYGSKVIGWDVNNENLHFDYFESRLGPITTDVFFKKAYQLNPSTTLFMNDYNTIEDERDPTSSPSRYIQKIMEIYKFVGSGAKLGIGLESHFITANIPYVRSALDALASTKFPIWITELDVQEGPSQISDFEKILREVHSHPGVQGIVMWGPWSPSGQCYKLCLVKPDFQNAPAGVVLDKLLGEWGRNETLVLTTDETGFIHTSLFHGDYEVKLLEQQQQEQRTLNVNISSISQSFKVDEHSLNKTFRIIC